MTENPRERTATMLQFGISPLNTHADYTPRLNGITAFTELYFIKVRLHIPSPARLFRMLRTMQILITTILSLASFVVVQAAPVESLDPIIISRTTVTSTPVITRTIGEPTVSTRSTRTIVPTTRTTGTLTFPLDTEYLSSRTTTTVSTTIRPTETLVSSTSDAGTTTCITF
ncbi:hypothetical protein BDQ12DRAFT_728386 [Crucibulum laeve]|uniref:Uncharacterized protein n=1 Tax=Crucibulum laeve TaxID=68775 RepID=A0A5C3LJH4_9AGAR|nr:hypothetical protein BDQ12DRAFT_728386 [Crucibulum laeve]